jgi:hypothetical protein
VRGTGTPGLSNPSPTSPHRGEVKEGRSTQLQGFVMAGLVPAIHEYFH